MAKGHSISVPDEDEDGVDGVKAYIKHKRSKGIIEAHVWVTALKYYMENVDINWQQEKIRHDEEETRLITAATLLDQKDKEKEDKQQQQKQHQPLERQKSWRDNFLKEVRERQIKQGLQEEKQEKEQLEQEPVKEET